MILEAAAPATVRMGRDETTVQAEVDALAGVSLRLAGVASSVRGACHLQISGSETRIEVPSGRRRVEVSLGAGRQNSAPVAVVQAPATALAGEPILLDGGESCDADGQPLTYRWEVVEAPAGAVLAGERTARTTLTGNLAGSHRVALIVSDGALSDRAEVAIEVFARPLTTRGSSGCITAAASFSGAALILVGALLGLALARKKNAWR